MFSKSFFVAAAIAAFATVAQGARVQFYTSRDNCAGAPAEDFQNIACNTCVDPAGGTLPRYVLRSTMANPPCVDWFAVQVSDIGNTRWSINNQVCTSALRHSISF